MNIELFAGSILGHFVGDYLFQNQWMGIGKSQKGWQGTKICTIHVALYTLAIALFTGWYPLFLLVVAIPHWIIDRYSLAWYLLKWKNGEDQRKLWRRPEVHVSNDVMETSIWQVAFAAPIYIFNDNTMHWVCLWFSVKYLLR